VGESISRLRACRLGSNRDRRRASWRCRLRLLFVALWLLACGAGERSSEARAAPGESATAERASPAQPLFVTVAQRAPRAPRAGARRRELTWSLDGPFGPNDVVVSIPEDAGPERRLPVLVALHGRGESRKGSRRGARGWIDDYALDQALTRLAAPPLGTRDFQGYVSRPRLKRINRELGEHPYAGLIVVCPYLPDVLRRGAAFERAEELAGFIVDVLLPRVYAETPAIGTPETTGIDGVSLGGRASLLVGAARPQAFGAVGALQAALDGGEVAPVAELMERAVVQNPDLKLRLLTSGQDHFRRVNQRLSAALTKKGVRHQYLSVVGTHSYRFNRGPGALEMLLFHDRALRGMPWR
jgi:iron(III)-salmochelin esterase